MRSHDPELLFLELSGEAAAHLCLAVQEHRHWARRAGLAVPDELDELDEIERALANRARRGHDGTPLEDLWSVRHPE